MRAVLVSTVLATLLASGLASAARADEPRPTKTPAPTTPATTTPPATTPTTTTPAAPTTTAEPTDAAPELKSPDQRFKRGKSLFEYRDCPGTIAAIAELAVPGQLADEADQLEVHRMLGICHGLVDTPDHKREAAREFSSLLSIDPDFVLDPFEVPPNVVEIFETQKTAMKARLDEIRKARAKEDNFDDGGVLVERTTQVRVTPLPVVFVPFGLAQLANGDLGRGALYGGIQGVALVVNVVGFWGTYALQAEADANGGAFSPAQAQTETILWWTEKVALAVLVSSYAVSVGDAWWNREDQLVLADKQTKRPLTSSELKKLKRIERAPDPEPALDSPAPP